MFNDEYKLSDFSDQEQRMAKKFIAEAIRSLVDVSADRKAEELFEQLEGKLFDGEDHITINFSITTVGNDIITAMGAARRQIGLSLKNVKVG